MKIRSSPIKVLIMDSVAGLLVVACSVKAQYFHEALPIGLGIYMFKTNMVGIQCLCILSTC